jgi:selenocysteine lyase/cysteine desulfurase
MSCKRLFSRSLAAAPQRLHFIAHGQHLWPDASLEGQVAAWADAALLADKKWALLLEQVLPEAQDHIAHTLSLPDPAAIAFGASTHDLLIRLFSAVPERPIRVAASDGEFLSFRRQAQRWSETGQAVLTWVERAPETTLAARLGPVLRAQRPHVVFLSQVAYRTGGVLEDLAEAADACAQVGAWLVIDGYHGFHAVETDLSALAPHLIYLAGTYKYAMSGEGLAFAHVPPGWAQAPALTGWFAAPSAEVGEARVAHHGDWRRFLGATFDATPFYRFNAVARMLAVEGLGVGAVNAHVAPLRARLEQAWRDGALGPLSAMRLLNPARPGRPHARFLSFEGPHTQAVAAALDARQIAVNARDGVLRIGLGLYHDAEDVEALSAACAALVVGS